MPPYCSLNLRDYSTWSSPLCASHVNSLGPCMQPMAALFASARLACRFALWMALLGSSTVLPSSSMTFSLRSSYEKFSLRVYVLSHVASSSESPLHYTRAWPFFVHPSSLANTLRFCWVGESLFLLHPLRVDHLLLFLDNPLIIIFG